MRIFGGWLSVRRAPCSVGLLNALLYALPHVFDYRRAIESKRGFANVGPGRCSLETVAMIVCGLYTNPLKISANPASKSALGCRVQR